MKQRKIVLDEREMQELGRIEHGGLWLMYALLCTAIAVQLFLGAGFAQVAGEACVLAVVSLWQIAAYARRGIWDIASRPSVRGNAAYAGACGVCASVFVLGMYGKALSAVCAGLAAFAGSFIALTGLMAYVQHRQKQQASALEADDAQEE